MGLETVTHISDLVTTNPTSGDPKAQGDDHLRNIKTALKTDFPSIAGAMTLSHTQLNLLDNKSLSSNGYQKLPSGLIVQWGTTASIAGGGSTTGVTTFPVAFPAACGVVLITPNGSPGAGSTPSWVTAKTASNFTLQNQHANASTFLWMAIGW